MAELLEHIRRFQRTQQEEAEALKEQEHKMIEQSSQDPSFQSQAKVVVMMKEVSDSAIEMLKALGIAGVAEYPVSSHSIERLAKDFVKC